jgi:COP9 signalosome complex subunit 1
MGHNDLGDYFYEVGDYVTAQKYFAKSREFCTTPRHVIDMCLKLVKVF